MLRMMSARSEIPHMVGMSPTALYGSIICPPEHPAAALGPLQRFLSRRLSAVCRTPKPSGPDADRVGGLRPGSTRLGCWRRPRGDAFVRRPRLQNLDHFDGWVDLLDHLGDHRSVTPGAVALD